MADMWPWIIRRGKAEQTTELLMCEVFVFTYSKETIIENTLDTRHSMGKLDYVTPIHVNSRIGRDMWQVVNKLRLFAIGQSAKHYCSKRFKFPIVVENVLKET